MNKNLVYYLKISGMLFLICAITALIVASVYGVTNEKIAKNEEERKNESISDIFGENITTKPVNYKGNSDIIEIREVYEDDILVGYAVNAKPMGFKDSIEMMVGITPEGVCKSVRILSHSETPGLGSKVEDESFRRNFEGADKALEVKEDIEPVTGATRSSKAVTKGVNDSLEAVNELIASGGGK